MRDTKGGERREKTKQGIGRSQKKSNSTYEESAQEKEKWERKVGNEMAGCETERKGQTSWEIEER